MTDVVLLHPIGLDRTTWRFVSLPEARPIDLPGHGESETLEEVTLDALAQFVCDQVSGDFHLVGLSMGGIVAQHVAIRYPDRVASLVIACASGVTTRSVVIDRALEIERVGMPGVVEDYLARWFSPEILSHDEHLGVAYARSRLIADDPLVVASYWRAMAVHDVMDLLPQISAPTTVVAGSADRSVPVDRMREVASRIPDSRFRVVDGPHMLQLEVPTLFRDVLVEHIEYVKSKASIPDAIAARSISHT
jgi:pimeloyl-ACP methyl ester carboxylesterase